MAKTAGNLVRTGPTLRLAVGLTLCAVSAVAGSTPTGITISSSINPSVLGQGITLTATIGAQGVVGQYRGRMVPARDGQTFLHPLCAGICTLTGSVTFFDGATVLGTADVSQNFPTNAASLVTSQLAVGVHSLSAHYGGDGNYAASTSSPLAQTVTLSPPPADLTIVKTHTGNFTQGQTGAAYTIIIFNIGSTTTSGVVTVTDTLPGGLTAVGISVAGWNCVTATVTCTRSDSLAAAANYPSITVTVNIAANAPISLINTATVSGGGETNTGNDTASDPAQIGVVGISQTITFAALGDRMLGAPPFALAAAASSGLPVSFVSNTNTVCTVSGSTATLVAAGTCSITATQAGNTAYAAAASVTRSFIVTPVVSVLAPSITSLSPSSAFAGTHGPLYEVKVTGSGFNPGGGVLAAFKSVVLLNGVPQPTAVIDSNNLVFELDALNDQDLANVGILTVVVQNTEIPGALYALSNPLPFTVIPPPLIPSINPGGIVSSSDAVVTVAPGSLMSAYGVFPLNSPAVCRTATLGVCAATGTPLPTVLSGLSMQFSGIPVPLMYADEFLVNGQAPWELSGQTTAQAVASVNNRTSFPQTVHLATYAPGIFTMGGYGFVYPFSEYPIGAILNSHYQLVQSAHGYQAIAGDVIQIYCTGLGPVTNQPSSGVAASITPLSNTTTTPIVTIGGKNATVLFSGLTPTTVGLYQVNVIVPDAGIGNAADDAFQSVTLEIGGVKSNTVAMPYADCAACR